MNSALALDTIRQARKMVLNDLMFTVAGDGLAKGTRAPKPPRKKGSKKIGSATPATTYGRDTPASAVTQGMKDHRRDPLHI